MLSSVVLYFFVTIDTERQFFCKFARNAQWLQNEWFEKRAAVGVDSGYTEYRAFHNDKKEYSMCTYIFINHVCDY